MYTIYDVLNEKLNLCDTEIQRLTDQLNTLPPGKLIVTRYHTRYKWYVKEDHNLIYLSKSQKNYVDQLAQRKYISMKLEDLLRERNAIYHFLEQHSKETHHAEQLLMDDNYHSLLAPCFQLPSQDLLDWANSPYEHNPKFPEQLTLKSISGNTLRSKSELLIDLALFSHKLPFRYECALQLDHSTLFPDFTILHPVTHKVYYWEHFGLMDNSAYAKNAYSKLELYTSHNIIPSFELITTFETKDHPLSSDLVEDTIQRYFLT